MPDLYYCPVMDGETAYVSVVSSGTRKTIRHDGFSFTAAEPLVSLEEAIDGVADTATKWRL